MIKFGAGRIGGGTSALTAEPRRHEASSRLPTLLGSELFDIEPISTTYSSGCPHANRVPARRSFFRLPIVTMEMSVGTDGGAFVRHFTSAVNREVTIAMTAAASG